jgi:hypothetical protein
MIFSGVKLFSKSFKTFQKEDFCLNNFDTDDKLNEIIIMEKINVN